MHVFLLWHASSDMSFIMKSKFKMIRAGKTPIIFSIGLLILPSIGFADSSIEMIVVAEQSKQGVGVAHPSSEHPTYYVSYDGGYLEAGSQVIGGLKPPSPAIIDRALQTSLESQGYQPATTQNPPSLLLICHWGSIRDETTYRSPANHELEFASKSHSALLLSYVFPSRFFSPQAKASYLADKVFGEMASTRRQLIGFDPSTLNGNRSFVIVTAYDFAGLQRHEKILLWRVKLSSEETSAEMVDALPALIGAGGPYFARNLDTSQVGSASLAIKTGTETGNGQSPPVPTPSDEFGQETGKLVRDLSNREINEFVGAPQAPTNDKIWTKKQGKRTTDSLPSSTVPGHVDMTVVAEQTNAGKNLTRPTPEQPAYYVAYDGGYIEAGDPIAGEKPPTPAAISHALHSALASQGYVPATPQAAASLVLTYHWGMIRRDTFPQRNLRNIDPNLKARLMLSAPAQSVRKIEEYLMDRKISVVARLPNFGFLGAPLQNALDRARDDHYFVVVSAYDYAAFARGEKAPLWRIKLRARETSGSMDEVLPALLGASGPYFGRDEKEADDIKASTYFPPASEPAADEAGSAAFVGPEMQTESFAVTLRALLKLEHDAFSGQRYSAWEELEGSNRSSSAVSERPALPTALAASINAYQQEKRALQDALAVKIKAQTPGAATSQSIDRFNAENADRIAALNRLGENIRGELAKLSTENNPGMADKSLDTLRREFAADVRQKGELPGGSPQ